MRTILDVTNADLKQLGPEDAVEFFRRLLWAEATADGIAAALLNVPSNIDAADGGVDADARNVTRDSTQGILQRGINRYQIKTGEFSPSENRDLEDLLFQRASRNLKPRIKSCLDCGGRFVVVLFAWDNPDRLDDGTSKKIKAKLVEVDPSYESANIEVWGQNKLRMFISRFPSLALQLSRHAGQPFLTHRGWTRLAEMRHEFHPGTAQTEILSHIRTELHRENGPVHVHVVGDPGIGKTRLILEATSILDLEPFVIYCSRPTLLRDSAFLAEMTREDSLLHAILVVDDCSFDDRLSLWNSLRECSPRIKLITISGEEVQTTGDTLLFQAPPLLDAEVGRILNDYGIPEMESHRWVSYCSGFPRVAHVLGANLKNNPDDLLQSPDTINVWGRFICGPRNPESAEVKQRKMVLCHLALFKRFGMHRSFDSGIKAIARMIERVEPSITESRFRAIVAQLRREKILQGGYVIYITPKLFHIWLWVEWFKAYDSMYDPQSFRQEFRDPFWQWHQEMFEYARETAGAIKVVQRLLGPDGLFTTGHDLNLNADFFLSLANADPASAIDCLHRTIRSWDRSQLLELRTGRRKVVEALERISIWNDHFLDAARLLLRLAEAENEDYSNNATGVFIGLFSPACGRLAVTEAAPRLRLPILREALDSNSKEQRMIGLRACNQALQTELFTRSIGAEYQGLRPLPELWTPKDFGELFEYYREVWQLLSEKLDCFDEDEQAQVATICLDHACELSRFNPLTDIVFETIRNLQFKGLIDPVDTQTKIARFLHYRHSSLNPETLQRWQSLSRDLVGSDYGAKMRRYVGLYLVDEEFDAKGTLHDMTEKRMSDLAVEGLNSRLLSVNELSWLVSPATARAYEFGYAAGRHDVETSVLNDILKTQRESGQNAHFLGGYLRAIGERDPKEFWEYWNRLKDDDQLACWLPEISVLSGMISDRAALELLELAKTGKVAASSLGRFVAGGLVTKITGSVFDKWIEFLLEHDDIELISEALRLFDHYYLFEKSDRLVPKLLAMRLLCHDSLFQGSNEYLPPMTEYYWECIGMAFVQTNPVETIPLAEIMLANLGKDGTVVEGFFPPTLKVLDDIAKLHPKHVWEIVTKFLAPRGDSRAFHISSWLQGGEFASTPEGALTIFLPDLIWAWVDTDPEPLAPYLARFVPPNLFHSEDRVCLAREILARYGQIDGVFQEFSANFHTEGFSGPGSLHYNEKKQKLEEFLSHENDPLVRNWIQQEIVGLIKTIERERIDEETLGF